MVYADITYPAVVLHFRFFAKITQKLARTADAVVLCITDNALDGATNTVYFIEDLQDAGCKIKLAGVFFTIVDTRTELAKVNIPSAKQNRFKPGDVLNTIIVQSEQVRKAENLMRPASDAYPTCNAVKNYAKLLAEVVNKIG